MNPYKADFKRVTTENKAFASSQSSSVAKGDFTARKPSIEYRNTHRPPKSSKLDKAHNRYQSAELKNDRALRRIPSWLKSKVSLKSTKSGDFRKSNKDKIKTREERLAEYKQTTWRPYKPKNQEKQSKNQNLRIEGMTKKELADKVRQELFKIINSEVSESSNEDSQTTVIINEQILNIEQRSR